LEAIGNPVGPRYFETMGIRLVGGREFTERDRSGAPPVVIVNDVLARRLWPDGRAVGQTLAADGRPHEIVGVVADAQYYSAGDAPRPQVFFSYWQPANPDAFLNDSRTFVRVAGDPALKMRDILRAVAAVDSSVPISEAYPLRDRVAYAFQPVRLARAMLTSFALLALLLSAVGLYGVLAFSVGQRTREIGVRIALGATRADVIALVMREGLIVTAIGVAAGLFAAWHASHLVASLLFGVAARDITAFIAAPALLLVVALAASYLPARRAAGVSPLAAIRTE
jgi:predicted permease